MSEFNQFITISEATKRVNLKNAALRRACESGAIKGAIKQPAPLRDGFFWLIPISQLDNIEIRPKGRPKKIEKFVLFAE